MALQYALASIVTINVVDGQNAAVIANYTDRLSGDMIPHENA